MNGAYSDICGPVDRPADGTVIGVLATAFGASSGSRRSKKERIDMRKLERTRDFGTFKGQPFIPDGCDRVAIYQQDGRLFDAQDREIIPGVSLQAARARRRQADEHNAEAAAALLAGANKVPPGVLKSMARLILGPTCPAKKADILGALEAMLAGNKAAGASMEDEEAATRPKAPEINGHKGVSFQSVTGAKPEAPRQAAPAAKPKAAPPPAPQVNLAAWARGDAQYPFHEIRRSIEERLGVAVTDANAALEVLIDNGVIGFKEARADLLPPPIEVEDQAD